MMHVKSQSDIDRMRKSADLVGRTLAEVARLVEPGVSTSRMDEVAEAFIVANGGEPAFKGYGPHGNQFPATLCISVNDVVVHGIPNGTLLEEGDIVSVDCGVKLDGFYGDYAYTFAVGEISDEKQQLLNATVTSLYMGAREAIAGNRVGDIGHAVQSFCEDRGFGVVRELVGHGVGRNLHEDPQIPNFGRRGHGRKLRNGLTICIEPMINAGTARVRNGSDGWTVRTADGKPSAHFEHMVLVKNGESEILSTYEYIEDVVDRPYEILETVHG